ncbi:hypothetical protein TRVL_08607 [Trypanosoma vivax]|nr:hypothetical protein TRVL_08607 [Trypanosoma vivax]
MTTAVEPWRCGQEENGGEWEPLREAGVGEREKQGKGQGEGVETARGKAQRGEQEAETRCHKRCAAHAGLTAMKRSLQRRAVDKVVSVRENTRDQIERAALPLGSAALRCKGEVAQSDTLQTEEVHVDP